MAPQPLEGIVSEAELLQKCSTAGQWHRRIPDQCHPSLQDLSDIDATSKFAKDVLGKHSMVHVLVNNAGRGVKEGPGPVEGQAALRLNPDTAACLW